MFLAIDIGNTNIVIGKYTKNELTFVTRIVTDAQKSESEYAVTIKSILSLDKNNTEKIDGAIISSVVPPLTNIIKNAVKMLYGVDSLVVGPGIKTGINLLVDNPAQVGADLICACVAAYNKYPSPSLIIDMGTATTMVVVDKNNCYVGGAILPGVNLSFSALASGTSLLPDISIAPPKKCIATNTVDAMRSGAVFGTAATIDGMIDRMESELGYKCRIVATGGLAQAITPHCKHDIVCDDDLLLKGLWVLYQKNKK
jgi:type III pantothenate kinase